MLDTDLRRCIAQVQQGQGKHREELIQRYLPFILKVTSQTCKRFVRMGEDDEVSIALIAFNEALDKYDCSQNTSFFAFAEAVIKRRIIDYFRKKERENREIPWSALNDEEEGQESHHQLEKLTWEGARARLFDEEANQMRRSEILEYNKQLAHYGITMQDLLEASPKHQDARVNAFRIAQLIYKNEKYRRHLEKTKSLPLKELEREVRVSRKTMERQRKYIIALTIILTGEYYFLQDYVSGLRG